MTDHGRSPDGHARPPDERTTPRAADASPAGASGDRSPPPAAGALPARMKDRDTHTALLDAAHHLFARRGFDGASVRAITRRAGANLGAVTYHFGSKRNLYTAVLERELRPLADRVGALAGHEGTGLEGVSAVMQAYFEHLASHPDLPRLMLQEIAAGRHPPDPVPEVVRTVTSTIALLQARGLADGSVRPTDPLLTALSVVAQPVFMTLVSPLFAEIAGHDLTAPERRRAMVQHAATFVRAGLGARDGAPPAEGRP